MTATSPTPMVDQMTGAELRAFTEAMGLNVAFLARRWRSTESTIKNWMKGSHEVPEKFAADVTAMVNETNDRLDELLATLKPRDEVGTYRTDFEYHQELGDDAPFNAAWHRSLCARAADEVDVRIVYAIPPDRQWRRNDNGEYVRVRNDD